MRKSAVLTLLLTGLLTFGATAARGQGGACPTTAQYVNISNPTGPLVTLASKGITRCFYIAANGSDSNDGLSEASGHPWLHAPKMLAATGNPAALTPASNQGFIFRGGDTWHVFTGSPQIGLPAGYPSNASPNGWEISSGGSSPSNPIYIGVDITWFTGSVWTRPIINNDNPTFKPPSPSITIPANNAVSGCLFPQGNLIDLLIQASNVEVDNFEFTGMCWNDAPTNNSSQTPEKIHSYIQHGTGATTSGRSFVRNYFHGWSHTAFTPSTCGNSPPTGVCDGSVSMDGQSGTTSGTLIAFNICDGSDSDDLSFTCVFGDAYDFEENVVRHEAGTRIINNCHITANNLFEHIQNSVDNHVHGDMYFCNGEFAANSFTFNNLIRFIGTDYGIPLSAVFWFNANTGFTDYIFNNVGHDINCAANCNNFATGVPPVSTNLHALIYNNTWESLNVDSIWKNQNTTNYSFTTANNHYITENGTGCAAVFGGNLPLVNGGNTSCSGDLFQTHTAANAQGYTSANNFRSTASTNATVKAGANENAISGPFGTAFLSSTTLACTESFTNTGFGSPTVVCPGIAPSVRLVSGTCTGTPLSGPGCWDLGAFGFVSSTVTLTPTAYTFAATAVGNNSSDSPVTFTLTNNTGVTITAVTISLTGANAGDFGNTTSCGTTLANSASCRIFVTFTPTALGSRTATLSVSDSDSSSPQTSSLSGTGTPSVTNPSPANPVTFGVVVTDPSIPSTVKNEKHSDIQGSQSPASGTPQSAPACWTGRASRAWEISSAYNFDHVVLAGFLHQDRAGDTPGAFASQ
jgi:hypothetical protein